VAYTLKITDGSTTVDLTGTDGYQVVGEWAPQIATRRKSKMGGRSPYNDVEEQMTIVIKGTSTANALSKLATLSELMDQAQSFGRGGNGTAVQLEYLSAGSSASSVQAVILGPAGDGPMIELAGDFSETEVGGGKYIRRVYLTFLRRGLWLGATEAKSSSESNNNPTKVATSSFSNTADILNPLDIKIKVNRVSGSAVQANAYVLLQNGIDKIYKVEAEDLSTLSSGGTFSTPAETDASGLELLRYTFTGSGQTGEAYDPSPALDATSGTMAFFCSADNNTGADLILQMQMRGVGSNEVTGPRIVVPSGNNVPHIYPLGILSVQPAIDYIELNLNAADATEDVNGTFDLDYLCGVVIDENAHIVQLTNILEEDTDVDLHFEHRLDSHLSPLVYETDSGSATKTNYPPYQGIASVHMTGSSVYAILMGIDEGGSYVIEDGSGGHADITLTATKTEGYLTPP
jgi:hypothetical protein